MVLRTCSLGGSNYTGVVSCSLINPSLPSRAIPAAANVERRRGGGETHYHQQVSCTMAEYISNDDKGTVTSQQHKNSFALCIISVLQLTQISYS